MTVNELHDLPELCLRRLLKATNSFQPNLDSEPWVVECQNVCWLLASEDGDLLKKLGSRFKVVEVE